MANMYTQVEFKGCDRVFNALIDSGNTFRNLISLRAFRCLNVNLLETTSKALSVDNNAVSILGKTPVLYMRFKDYDCTFPIQFEVLQTMQTDINLSYQFLFDNKAVLLFCDRLGNSMSINDMKIPLCTKNQGPQDFINTLLSEKKDDFVDEIKHFPGINYSNEGEGVDISEAQRYNVSNFEQIKVPAKSMFKLKVSSPCLDKGKVYFTPITKKAYVTKNGVLPLEAVYSKDNDMYINVINTNDYDTSLPKGCKLGYMYTTKDTGSNNTPTVSSINELSTEELKNRIDFIVKELGLKTNPITMNDTKLRSSIVKLFLDNYEVIAQTDDDIGHTDLIKFKINLKEGATPVCSRNWPLNPDQSAALRNQIEKWLTVGVIKPTTSAWNSPIFSVKKKTAVPGKFDLRFVLDFRRLNECTKTEVYPLPNIDSNIGKLGGAKIFSTVDACQAYHTISVDEDSQEYLAFSSESGSYTFVRMPFGCKNSANVFQRLINKALSMVPGIGAFCLSYLDDLIVYSFSIDEHLSHLRIVIKLMSRCGIKLKLSKCNIFRNSVKYLGHIVSSKDIKMDPFYLERVKNWARPKSGKEMQSFLGFLNYYRSYLPNFASTTYKLDALRNEKQIIWTDELISVFESSKSMFHSSVSKGYPDWRKTANKFVLDIDWSKHCIAAVLSQEQNGQEVLIGALSRKCSVAESRYSSHKGEASALVYALEKYNHFLRYKPFTVRTDSRSVLTTSNWKTKLLTGVTARWLEYIGTFDFNIVHRAGNLHTNADVLSRTPMFDKIKLPEDFKFDPVTKQNSEFLDTIYNIQDDSCQLNYALDTSQWVKQTNLDPTLKQIKDWVLIDHRPTLQERLRLNYRGRQLVKIIEFISINKGLLVFTQPTQNNTNKIMRTIVPLSLYSTIYDYAHNNAMTNHRGMLNTVHFLQKKFCMPYCRQYVQARVNNCITCLSKIKNKPQSKHIIENSDYSSIPFDSISVDTIGPLQKCEFRGKIVQHILIVVDSCTRYMWLHPLVDIKTETIIDCLCDEFVPMFSLFKHLKSDNGPSFVSKIFDGVMIKFGVAVRHSVVRTPNSNLSERYNQQVYALFKTNVFNNGNWAEKLKFVMLVSNCSHNYRTSFSPHFLLFKKDPVLPLDLIDPLGKDREKLNWHSNSFDKFVYQLESTYQLMKEQTDKYLSTENAKRREDKLFVSDLVYFFEDVVKIGKSRKLSSFFIGPFIVTKTFSDTLYEITPVPPNPTKRIITASIDKLRKVDGRVTLGDEIVGFNVRTSNYINIDTNVQLKYLSDEKFSDHISTRTNIIEKDSQNEHNTYYESSSDEEGDWDLENSTVGSPNVGQDAHYTPNKENDTTVDQPILGQGSENIISDNDTTIDQPILEHNNLSQPTLVSRVNKGKSFIQLSRKNKQATPQLSLKDLFSKRATRSSNTKEHFALNMDKPLC